MFLDLHSHSVSSDDSRATVEQYVKWIQVLRKRGHTVDGIDSRELMAAAKQHHALAVPAHPGRFGIGLTEYIEQGESFDGLEIVERVNGGSRAGENERAEVLCQNHGYLGIGGSDAHLTSHIAACMTEFNAKITDENSLVDALLSKEFRAVWLKDLADDVPN